MADFETDDTFYPDKARQFLDNIAGKDKVDAVLKDKDLKEKLNAMVAASEKGGEDGKPEKEYSAALNAKVDEIFTQGMTKLKKEMEGRGEKFFGPTERQVAEGKKDIRSALDGLLTTDYMIEKAKEKEKGPEKHGPSSQAAGTEIGEVALGEFSPAPDSPFARRQRQERDMGRSEHRG